MNEYNRGYRDGFHDGMKEFDRKHAQIMAHYEALLKYCSEIDLARPRVIVCDANIIHGDT